MRLVSACLLCWAYGVALPVHASTYVVSPRGDDHGTGRADDPFRTIQRAADSAKAGDLVKVEDGLYRESIALRNSGTKSAPILFLAIHPGMAMVTGADPIKLWSRLPGDMPIYESNWDHMFVIDTVNGKPIEHHPQEEPLWGRAEQVVSDGKQLLPVLGLSDLQEAWRHRTPKSQIFPPLKRLGGPLAGSFAVDTTHKKLYVWLTDGSDPNGHEVLASTRGQIFGVNPWEKPDGVAYVQVKGFQFRYGATFPQRPAVWLHGSHNLIEDCVIDQMSGSGVSVCGTLRNCLIENCGQTGGSALGEGFVNENDAWIGNCWKPIDRGWDAGGVKLCATQNGVFRHCLFRHKGGPGLWLDVWVHDVRITHCVFEENEGCGLFVEISHDIQADHNLAIGNAMSKVGNPPSWGDGGMVLAESENCEFTHNTCIGNQFGAGFREQGPRPCDTDTGHIDFHNVGDSITHNLLLANRTCQLGVLFDNGFFGRHPADNSKYPTEAAFSEFLKTIPEKVYDPTKQKIRIDFNVYLNSSSSEKSVQYGVRWRFRSANYARLSEFRQETGFESRGKEVGHGLDHVDYSSPNGEGWIEAPTDINLWIGGDWSPWVRSSLKSSTGPSPSIVDLRDFEVGSLHHL